MTKKTKTKKIRRFRIPLSRLDAGNPRIISILRLLGALEFANTTEKWYVKGSKGKTPLPPHESIECLVITCTYVAAALETYQKTSQSLEIAAMDKSNWSEDAKDALTFLESDDLKVFQANQLKRVRDKCAFHFDKEPAEKLCQEVSKGGFDEGEVTTLYREIDSDPPGHYPIAGLMIANWFTGVRLSDKEAARKKLKYDSGMIGKIVNALIMVTDAILRNEFPDAVRETVEKQ